jgi:hypothetical protein
MSQRYVTEVYRSELAFCLEKLSYELERGLNAGQMLALG